MERIKVNEQIKLELDEIAQKNLLRKTFPIQQKENCFIQIDGKKYIDFSSNDYLGLAYHEKIIAASISATQKFGTSSAASRLLSGTLDLHEQLEQNVAKFKGKESAIVFNSGYQANIGIIQTLLKKGDVIFSDKLNHASIIDGIQLSGIKFFRFKHNDINDLEKLLREHRKNFNNTLVITETIFSMDGDIAPLSEIVSLKQKYDFQILIDEAHATGIFGKNGSGIAEEFNLTTKIDYIMGTFSKGLGSFGAYLACSEITKNYLVNKCRSFIFSTALPPAVIGANIESLNIIKNEPERRKMLLKNTKYFRELLTKNEFQIAGETQIVPIIIGNAEKTVKISNALKNLGYWIMPIRYPTVPQNQARLRISLSFNHSQKMLDKLIGDLKTIIF